MSDWPWILAAYSLTWLVLGTYAFLVNRRLARARAELEAETRTSDHSGPDHPVEIAS